MGTLRERIESDTRVAAKAQDALRRDTLRFVLSAIHNEEVAKRRDLSDDEVVGVLGKQSKMRRESIEAFEKGDRPELVKKEKAELEIIGTYLPQQMERAEIEKLARAAIAETGATTAAEQGKVMQKLMPQVRGKADGKVVSEVVGSLLRGAG